MGIQHGSIVCSACQRGNGGINMGCLHGFITELMGVIWTHLRGMSMSVHRIGPTWKKYALNMGQKWWVPCGLAHLGKDL